MHSRIFELRTSPIDEEDYLTEEEVPEWFYGSVADYVAKSDRKEDIDWLKEFLDDFQGVRVTNDKLIIEDKEALLNSYFEPKLKELKETVSNMTLEDMSNSIIPYRVKKLVDPTFDFYIYNGENLYPLDEFIRSLRYYKESTLYFGNTLDYHY